MKPEFSPKSSWILLDTLTEGERVRQREAAFGW